MAATGNRKRPAQGRDYLSATLLTLLALSAPPLVSAARPPQAAGTAATAVKPQARATSGDEALDNAVAAVVVAALSERMANPSIAVNIDAFDVRVSSVRDRVVSGQGRMRVGDDEAWIGFRYSTLYDATFQSAGYPELVIGGVAAGEREIPNDARLLRQLEDRVAVELDKQFGDRSSRLQLDDIRTVEGGKRLLRISARGLADFGLNGSTPVRIEALYDQIAGHWQRIDYDLGASGAR